MTAKLTESDEKTLSPYDAPKEVPVITMAGNYYYRLHLIMLDADRAAMNNSLEQWYFSLKQIYINIKSKINKNSDIDKKTEIDLEFDKILYLLYNKFNSHKDVNIRNHHKQINFFKARQKLESLNAKFIHEIDKAKMLMPMIQKKDFTYFSKTVGPNQKKQSSKKDYLNE